MGAFIEINDTLRVTKEQGFPKELDLLTHLKTPYNLKDFQNKVFEFKDKPKIRVYKIPPIRNFLVEDIDGKWVYWGLCYITEIHQDYINQTTSGKFKIIYLNSPEEIKIAHKLIDANPETDYFSEHLRK